MIEAVQRFVVSRSEPHLEAAYGSRWFVGPFFLFLVVPAALMLWFVGRPVRVVVDRGSREVRIERSRFPLAPTVETWPIDEVTGATVEMTTRRNSNRPACRVALTLTGGVRVPLTSGYNSGAGVAERTAAQIQDALAAQG